MLIERAIPILLKAISFVGPSLASRLSKIFFVFAKLLKSRMYQTTERNIQLCFPGFPQEKQSRLVKASLVNLFYFFFEFAYMASWPKEKVLSLLIDIDGRRLLDQAISKRKGVLILVPHFGNFEFMEVFLGFYYDFAALYSEPKVRAFDKVLSDMRERHGGKMFATNGAGLRGVINELKKGGVTAILPDQVPGKNSGAITSTFFGNPIRYMSLVYRLIRKTRPEVLIASVTRIIRDNKLGYKITFEEPPDDLYSTERNIHGRALGEFIEKVVTRSPEQYQWEYKIFKDPSNELIPEEDVYRRQ